MAHRYGFDWEQPTSDNAVSPECMRDQDTAKLIQEKVHSFRHWKK
jgi:hypothetical protein